MPSSPRSGALVERTAEALGRSCRPVTPVGRGRPGHLVHDASSHPPAAGRRADQAISSTQAAVLAERARIARELHDSVSQTLYAISLGAARAQHSLQHSDRAQMQRLIDEVLQLASTGQSELRALLTDIRSAASASTDLVAAVEGFAADARTRHDLQVHVRHAGEPEGSPAAKEALALIAREALHNVAKHAAARTVEVRLDCQAERLTLVVADDGCGFDPAVARPGHFGLQSMHERAAGLGGDLSVTSAIGLGTQIRVSIPAHQD